MATVLRSYLRQLQICVSSTQGGQCANEVPQGQGPDDAAVRRDCRSDDRDRILTIWPSLLQRTSSDLHAGAVGCREVNVPVHAPGDKIRPVLLQNALIAELLGRLTERGETDAADRAHAAMLDAAAAKGFLQEDGSIECPTNIALFVTARP